MSAMARDHCLGAGMQISRARVITEPRPQLEHILERRLCERAHIRPARGKAREIGGNRLHRRLLQHDFREPNAIGVGLLARQCAPREDTAMAVIPKQKRRSAGARIEDAPRTDGVEALALARAGILSLRNARCYRHVYRLYGPGRPMWQSRTP